jgi:Ribosomally synthesized peptide prototyped by Frankia Franean1_4349.
MAGEAKKKSIEDLVGHALSDKAFRDRLLASPEATLEAEGYEVSPEVIQAIKSANLDDLSAFENSTADRKAAA